MQSLKSYDNKPHVELHCCYFHLGKWDNLLCFHHVKSQDLKYIVSSALCFFWKWHFKKRAAAVVSNDKRNVCSFLALCSNDR